MLELPVHYVFSRSVFAFLPYFEAYDCCTMAMHNRDIETANYVTFRECFTLCVGQSLAAPASKPIKRKKHRCHDRNKPLSQSAVSDELGEADDAQLSEFLEVLTTPCRSLRP